MENFIWSELIYLSIPFAAFMQCKKSWNNKGLLIWLIYAVITINGITAMDITNNIILSYSALISAIIMIALAFKYWYPRFKVNSQHMLICSLLITIIYMSQFANIIKLGVYICIPIMFVVQIRKSWSSMTKDISLILLIFQWFTNFYAIWDDKNTGYYGIVAYVTIIVISIAIVLYVHEYVKKKTYGRDLIGGGLFYYRKG